MKSLKYLLAFLLAGTLQASYIEQEIDYEKHFERIENELASIMKNESDVKGNYTFRQTKAKQVLIESATDYITKTEYGLNPLKLDVYMQKGDYARLKNSYVVCVRPSDYDSSTLQNLYFERLKPGDNVFYGQLESVLKGIKDDILEWASGFESSDPNLMTSAQAMVIKKLNEVVFYNSLFKSCSKPILKGYPLDTYITKQYRSRDYPITNFNNLQLFPHTISQIYDEILKDSMTYYEPIKKEVIKYFEDRFGVRLKEMRNI